VLENYENLRLAMNSKFWSKSRFFSSQTREIHTYKAKTNGASLIIQKKKAKTKKPWF